MEILQTIWTSLTTENEMLTNILVSPLSFLETYIMLLLFTTILNISANRKQKLYYISIVGIECIISNLIIPTPYNSFINLLVFLLCNIFILKTKFFKSILSIVIPFIISMLLESLVINLYNSLLNTNYMLYNNVPLYRFIFSLIIYSIEFIICFLLEKFKFSFAKIQIMNKKNKVLLTLTSILAVALIAGQFYILAYYSYTMPLFISLLNIIGLITYFFLNLYTMFTQSKLETTSMNLEEAQLYNKTLEILQDNTRAFRHDFANILQGMVGYMDNNDMDGLRKYYNQLVDDIQTSNNLTTLSPKVVNNPAIYNVLANKYHKADSLGIKIHLEAFLDMNELHMKIYEFTRILGILMDNAIEASSECEEKVINVTFRKDNRKHMQLLVIENTYKSKDIDTDKIFEKGYSTKQGNTGLGLWEIRQILKKNNNLNLFTSKNDEYFTQQFEIYY